MFSSARSINNGAIIKFVQKLAWHIHSISNNIFRFISLIFLLFLVLYLVNVCNGVYFISETLRANAMRPTLISHYWPYLSFPAISNNEEPTHVLLGHRPIGMVRIGFVWQMSVLVFPFSSFVCFCFWYFVFLFSMPRYLEEIKFRAQIIAW